MEDHGASQVEEGQRRTGEGERGPNVDAHPAFFPAVPACPAPARGRAVPSARRAHQELGERALARVSRPPVHRPAEMPQLSFLAKKSWHTRNSQNVLAVQKAEAQKEAEAKKMEELRKQIEEERQQEALQRMHEASGRAQPRQERVDWLYQAPAASSGPSAEEYLLGKEVKDEALNKRDSVTQSFHLRDSNAPGALWLNQRPARVDDAVIAREDPLFEMRRREAAARELLARRGRALAASRPASGELAAPAQRALDAARGEGDAKAAKALKKERKKLKKEKKKLKKERKRLKKDRGGERESPPRPGGEDENGGGCAEDSADGRDGGSRSGRGDAPGAGGRGDRGPPREGAPQPQARFGPSEEHLQRVRARARREAEERDRFSVKRRRREGLSAEDRDRLRREMESNGDRRLEDARRRAAEHDEERRGTRAAAQGRRPQAGPEGAERAQRGEPAFLERIKRSAYMESSESLADRVQQNRQLQQRGHALNDGGNAFRRRR